MASSAITWLRGFEATRADALSVAAQAGCCVVRTSSGDWAEACALEAQKAQEAAEAGGQATPSSRTSAGCHSCFRGACLGEEGEYVALEEQHGDRDFKGMLVVQLGPTASEASTSRQLSQLVGHHVPQQLSQGVR